MGSPPRQQPVPARRKHDAYVRNARTRLLDAVERRTHYLLIVDDASAADREVFLRELSSLRSHIISVDARSRPAEDPVRDGIAAAIWVSVTADAHGAETLHTAIVRNVPRGEAPLQDEIGPLLRRPNDDSRPPVGFSSLLPRDLDAVIDILAFVGKSRSWWIVVDKVAFDQAQLDSAIRLLTLDAEGVQISIVLGTSLTKQGWNRVNILRKTAPSRMDVFQLATGSDPQARPPVVHYMLDHKEAREATDDRRFWNDHVINAVLALIWAVGRVHDGQVGELADIFDIEASPLRRLLEEFEGIRHEADHFTFLRQPATTSNKQMEAEVLAIVEKLVTDTAWHRATALSLLKNLPRRGGSVAWHEDTGRFFRALLTTAYRYVQFREAGVAEALFEQARLSDDISDTRLALLYSLFMDSQHLSIIDYSLALITKRTGESSFEEMRIFRQACHEAQRYRDRFLHQQLTELAPRERLMKWVLPDELVAITRGEEWRGHKEWLAPFERRMRQFRIATTAIWGMARMPVDFDDDVPPHVASGPSQRRIRKSEKAHDDG